MPTPQQRRSLCNRRPRYRSNRCPRCNGSSNRQRYNRDPSKSFTFRSSSRWASTTTCGATLGRSRRWLFLRSTSRYSHRQIITALFRCSGQFIPPRTRWGVESSTTRLSSMSSWANQWRRYTASMRDTMICSMTERKSESMTSIRWRRTASAGADGGGTGDPECDTDCKCSFFEKCQNE